MLTAKAIQKGRVVAAYAVLAGAVVLAYEPVRRHDFVSLDDNQYVTANPQVQGGITRPSVCWAFTSADGNWHPLTWLSHMLDCDLYGLAPAGHHLSNLFWHLAGTLLLVGVFHRLTGAFGPSWFLGAVFGLHPVHVESVAWVAERKDVLSAFFWMLTLAAYAHYAQRPGVARYLMVVTALGLGLLAKPMLVTLPCVLLLLDWWPLKRLEPAPVQEKAPAARRRARRTSFPARLARLMLEKAPLLALALASSALTLWAQRSAGAVKNVPLGYRLGQALISYVAYLDKLFFPRRLAVYYPYRTGTPSWHVLAAWGFLALITAAVILAGRRRRYLLVGWFWYLGTLVPVIGLVQAGTQAMADRYTYLPAIGVSIMVGWGLWEVLHRSIWPRRAGVLMLGVLTAALVVGTRLQVRHWRDSLSLYGHALRVTRNNYFAHLLYGKALDRAGRTAEALEQFRQSVAVKPDYADGWYNLGAGLWLSGAEAQAVACWYKTIEYWPNSRLALNNLAWIRATHPQDQMRNAREALVLAERACALAHYDDPEPLDTWAAAYAASGRFDLAVTTAEKALKQARLAANQELAAQIASRLQLYQQGRPYREPPSPKPSP